jgi:hypothetical protein
MAMMNQQKLLNSVMPPIDQKAARIRRVNPVVAKKALDHYQAKYGKNPSLALFDRPKTKEQY